MMRAFYLLPLLALAACQPDEKAAKPTDDTCGTARYEHLRGKPESGVMAVSFNQPVRIIHPHDAVTMDFLAERLNFKLDAGGNVADITCG